MSGAHKIRVPENYRPPGVRKKFFVNIMSGEVLLPSAPPPVGSRKIKKFSPKNLAFVLKTKLPHGDNVVFVLTSCPMKEQRTLILLNGHLVTIDEYREWIKDQQR